MILTVTAAFCDYLEKQYEELDKGSDELAPAAKERYLTQAAAPMFERHDALEWGHLHPKKWNVRPESSTIIATSLMPSRTHARTSPAGTSDPGGSSAEQKDEEDDEDTEDEDWFDKD